MAWTYNPPPNWPPPPPGWAPPPGWRPKPSWGPAPPGWQVWVRTTPLRYAVVARPFQPAPRPLSAALMVAVPTLSLGLASFAPPLWAAARRPGDEPYRRRMELISVGIAVLIVLGWAVYGSAAQDDMGAPSGTAAALGALMLVAAWAIGTAVAVRAGNAVSRPQPPVLAGVAQGLARRRLREQYREVAGRDPALARNIAVGRPDLPRSFDDGGLVDLNHIPAQHLGRFIRVPPAEARRIVDARERLGRFSSVEEVAVFADLSESSVVDLREVAVLL
jgi:hypothetical protein